MPGAWIRATGTGPSARSQWIPTAGSPLRHPPVACVASCRDALGTPLLGCGTWADDAVAVSCTGSGEQFIRAAVAHELSARVRHAGNALADAASAAIDGLDGGLIALG